MHRRSEPVIVRGVSALDVVTQLGRVFNARVRDWAAMRALYHQDALILTVTGGPAPLPADKVIGELERASQDVWYSVKASRPVGLDEHAALVIGRMRRSLPRGGFEDASHVWLLTVREGLIFRQGVFQSEDEAVDAYRDLGVTLGIGDAADAGSG